MKDKERIVELGKDFIVLAPFASRFPFEMWVLPRRHSPDFDRIQDGELEGLARRLKSSLRKLGSVLGNPSYNLIIHTAPNRTPLKDHWNTIEKDYHWHVEILPRVIKEGGFEWSTGFHINPTFPEKAADELREAEPRSRIP